MQGEAAVLLVFCVRCKTYYWTLICSLRGLFHPVVAVHLIAKAAACLVRRHSFSNVELACFSSVNVCKGGYRLFNLMPYCHRCTAISSSRLAVTSFPYRSWQQCCYYYFSKCSRPLQRCDWRKEPQNQHPGQLGFQHPGCHAPG